MTESQSQRNGNTLPSLAAIYPEAFAMAVASNSRTALAARSLAVADVDSLCGNAGVGAETGDSYSRIG